MHRNSPLSDLVAGRRQLSPQPEGVSSKVDKRLTLLSRELPQVGGFARGVETGTADSTGHRNTLVEDIGRSSVVEGSSGAGVELQGDGVELVLGEGGQVGALGEVLSQQAVGVLVRAALPGAVRVAEVDLRIGDTYFSAT